MEQIKRVFITGCNRGLGYELVKLIAMKSPQLEMHITSRNSSQKLAELFHKNVPDNRLYCYQMDINDYDSVKKTVEQLRLKKVSLDFIVANSAVCKHTSQIPTPQVARSILKTNLDSTIFYVKQLLPLLSQSGRVVMVSSEMGALKRQHKQLQQILSNPEITEKEILQISRNYVESAQKKDMGIHNWDPYSTSKALLNAWTRFVLPRYLKEGQSFICMNPGWCRTDMGTSLAPLAPEVGGQRMYDCLWMKNIVVDQFYSQTRFVSYMVCE